VGYLEVEIPTHAYFWVWHLEVPVGIAPKIQKDKEIITDHREKFHADSLLYRAGGPN